MALNAEMLKTNAYCTNTGENASSFAVKLTQGLDSAYPINPKAD